MSKLILASSIADTGPYTGQSLDKDPSEYNLLFVTTAAEGEPGPMDWVNNDRNGLQKAGFNITDYTFTDKTKTDWEAAIKNIDILFVNGGNTFFLLDRMRKTGFDQFIRDFLKKGGIYGGSSAGAMVMGTDIKSSKIIENLTRELEKIDTKGLGYIPFEILPHWGSSIFEDSYMETKLKNAYQKDYPRLLLTDNSYVVVESGKIEVITCDIA